MPIGLLSVVLNPVGSVIAWWMDGVAELATWSNNLVTPPFNISRRQESTILEHLNNLWVTRWAPGLLPGLVSTTSVAMSNWSRCIHNPTVLRDKEHGASLFCGN